MKVSTRPTRTLRARLQQPEAFFDESVRYLRNAHERLKQVPIQYDRYQDVKPVREAAATAYVGVLLALDGFLLKQGVSLKELPRKVDTYQQYLSQYSHHNGRLISTFGTIYDFLHVFIYYEGRAEVNLMKYGMSEAKALIQTLTHRKI